MRRVEDITEALWGTRVSAGTVSELNQKVYAHIDAWRERRLSGSYPYVHLDGICLFYGNSGNFIRPDLVRGVTRAGACGPPVPEAHILLQRMK